MSIFDHFFPFIWRRRKPVLVSQKLDSINSDEEEESYSNKDNSLGLPKESLAVYLESELFYKVYSLKEEEELG